MTIGDSEGSPACPLVALAVHEKKHCLANHELSPMDGVVEAQVQGLTGLSAEARSTVIMAADRSYQSEFEEAHELRKQIREVCNV